MDNYSKQLIDQLAIHTTSVYGAVNILPRLFSAFCFFLLLSLKCQASEIQPSNANQTADSLVSKQIEVGKRPHFLVEDMNPSPLKSKLLNCKNTASQQSLFSIAHRGAPLEFPEHTKESYLAAAKQGAGIIECDATFTKDRELVCRHSQCDLHSTTNILSIPQLAEKCTIPFSPADPIKRTVARAKCCTSDITLNEFKSLCGRMDSVNKRALSVRQYLNPTKLSNTDAKASCGTVLSHKESIDLFKQLDVKYAPELKAPQVDMPFEGEYSQQQYAQQLINEYKQANIPPSDVWAQSFNKNDLLYWVSEEPEFSKQAVFLDERTYKDSRFKPTLSRMQSLKNAGINIIAPPIFALLTLDANKQIVPSKYAKLAQAADLKIIAWSLERSGSLAKGGGFYYQTIKQAIKKDGDTYKVLDILAQQVGVIGVFSDWPATVTYYANCMNLE